MRRVRIKQRAGFNSQRDGILRKDNFFIATPFLFQFPTGWNSTQNAPTQSQETSFQFPTGWNSTLTGLSLERYSSCFNSQRDGILPLFLAKFQIQIGGFNSQRDGILLFYFSSIVEKIEFQFPTGWNSTYIALRVRVA